MAKRGKCGCFLITSDELGEEGQFDFSGNGYRAAVEVAIKRSRERRGGQAISSFVDVVCDDGTMPLLYCTHGSCVASLIGSHDSRPASLAGLGSKKARGKYKRKKRTGPLTPQQKKFKAAAQACKGSADYRGCVTRKLRK